MIVSDDDVSAALQYLSADPHPIALALKDATDAENQRRAKFAELYEHATGTVKDRECAIERDVSYQVWLSKESDALMELERHKARIRAAENLLKIYQTENANARAAERIR